ncbi:hypothetical protein CJA_2858 [Cellvibrio japonicus Ueda107]|uniref:Uncharacterized protein n=1 Tax=Cellvibrio japonicus (strain Ueda107) TaxID=498211 RepID=B3PC45_CELJU|nr:hypothetical protein CJA_2858 [Cellvibrio japonicus Ueda107]
MLAVARGKQDRLFCIALGQQLGIVLGENIEIKLNPGRKYTPSPARVSPPGNRHQPGNLGFVEGEGLTALFVLWYIPNYF